MRTSAPSNPSDRPGISRRISGPDCGLTIARPRGSKAIATQLPCPGCALATRATSKPAGAVIASAGGASRIGVTSIARNRASIGGPWWSWNASCPSRRNRVASPSTTSVISVPLIQWRTRVPCASTTYSFHSPGRITSLSAASPANVPATRFPSGVHSARSPRALMMPRPSPS